jgi:hypothetical protein
MKTPKQDWLDSSGLDYSAEDRWLRDKIAALFDVEQPSEAQRYLLGKASQRLTLLDLPSNAYPGHKEELMAMAQSMFGPPPRALTK